MDIFDYKFYTFYYDNLKNMNYKLSLNHWNKL